MKLLYRLIQWLKGRRRISPKHTPRIDRKVSVPMTERRVMAAREVQ